MPDQKVVQLFPSDPAPDSSRERAEAERLDRERREAHIREEVAKIPPLPSGVEALAQYGARMARDLRVDIIQMRVHADHARDVQSAETRAINDKLDWVVGYLTGLGEHVEERDSVSNEMQLEQAEQAAKIKAVESKAAEAKDKAIEAAAAAVEAKTVAKTIKDFIPESTWAKGGKATATITALAAIAEGIARAVGIDGLTGLATKIFGGH